MALSNIVHTDTNTDTAGVCPKTAEMHAAYIQFDMGRC